MSIPVHYTSCPIPREEALRIVALINAVWPTPGKTLEELAHPLSEGVPADQPEREILVIWDGPRAIAHTKTFRRSILHEGCERVVMALAGVCVHPDYRGRGLGERIVREAFGRVDRGEFPVCLFQTGVPAFYRALGAVNVRNAFTNRHAVDAAGSPWWDPEIMIYPGSAEWPQGPIDLNGPGY